MNPGIGGHETEALIGEPLIDTAHMAGALICALIRLGQQLRQLVREGALVLG